jgi:hypothetical protein
MKQKIVVTGTNDLIEREARVTFVEDVKSTVKRNACLALMSGIDVLSNVEIYEVSDEGEKLIASLTPNDFTDFDGSWSIAWGDGFTPVREFDSARAQTFVKKYTVSDVDGSKTSENIRIDARVDLQEAIYEALRALKGETKDKSAAAPRETKAQLKEVNDGLRAALVTLAKRYKIVITDDMTVEQINDALASGLTKTK